MLLPALPRVSSPWRRSFSIEARTLAMVGRAPGMAASACSVAWLSGAWPCAMIVEGGHAALS
jgi:hypothetical protein